MAGHEARLSGSFLLYKLRGLDSTRSDAFPDASDMSRSQAMPHQNTVFRQLANRLPWAALERAIGEHRAEPGRAQAAHARDAAQLALCATCGRAQPARHRGAAREPAGAALPCGAAAGAAL